MRIISGQCKGRRLKAVPGKATRPTSDKMKETIFNWFGPYFSGGNCLDLYAGSGGIGLEALSRGMDFTIFVDHQKQAVETIKANLDLCKMAEHAEVYHNDSERALKAIGKRGLQFDFIFLDPPYKRQKLEKLLEFIGTHSLLKDDGCVICEYDATAVLPEKVGTLSQTKKGDYGLTRLSMYTLTGKKEDSDD